MSGFGDCMEMETEDGDSQSSCSEGAGVISEWSGSVDEPADLDVFNIQTVSASDVSTEMKMLVSEVASVIQLPRTMCRVLLGHCKWDKEALFERYYESGDSEALFAKAGIASPSMLLNQGGSSTPKSSMDVCTVCFENGVLVGLLCGHRFCKSCWNSYLHVQTESSSRGFFTCPQPGCSALVDDEQVLRLLRSDVAKTRYRRIIVNSFIGCNPLLRWCPGEDCGRVIKVSRPGACAVYCKCGTGSCFACGHEWHEPVDCALLKKWLIKCADDNETYNWISANTKDCPKCKTAIEKNGGCNHMTCKASSCGYEFCWVCLGAWTNHTAGFYVCNLFEGTNVTLENPQARGRSALERYLHYYNRFVNHDRSLKLEHKLYGTVRSKMSLMQCQNMSWAEVQYLLRAFDVLSQCRRTLMYTYPFAYYLQKDNQAMIFETNQSDLELATEQLSEFLERDIENEDMVSLKQKVQDKYRYVEMRRTILIQHCQEGIKQRFWKFMS